MNPKIENTMSRIADDARGRFGRLLTSARRQTKTAAETVAKGKRPLVGVSKLGLELTAHTHKTADKVLKQQTKMIENQIDAVANRLQVAATAKDFRGLVNAQLRLIPVNASRFVEDTRATLAILAGAGVEFGNIVKASVTDLKTATATKKAKKAAAKTSKTVKKTAKKVTRKVNRKKVAAKKAVAAAAANVQQAA